MILNKDIAAEILWYASFNEFRALSSVNKLFHEVSCDPVVLNSMSALYDTLDYSRKCSRRCGEKYAQLALTTCDRLVSTIKKQIPPNHRPWGQEYVKEKFAKEEYYPFDKNMYRCNIYQKDPNVVGFQNLKLVMLT